MKQIKEYEYVDLGLPSGLKWAKCNVGAEKETDYGDYFQWGDIDDKTNYDCSWENYKYGDDLNLSKYNTENNGYKNGYSDTIDNKITLDLDDDAARANMGGNWRMPTEAEIQELVNNTYNEWIENFNGSGVNGRKFTSKTDKSKYIFIPASGVRSFSLFYFQGSDGYVWSSSINYDYPGSASFLNFGSGNLMGILYISRPRGLAVRGVMD